jgi:ketosteroid isomerase-like protein
MDSRSTADKIIGLETSALKAWLNGDPTPYLELYTNEFTYFDPVHEKRLDGWQTVKDLYESMRGQVKMDTFEILDPVVQSTDTMAVLTYNLRTRAGDTLWRENCTEVYKLEGEGWRIIHSHWSLTGPA